MVTSALIDILTDHLLDAHVPAALVKKYVGKCVSAWEDCASNFPQDIAQWEQDAADAARDTRDQRRIDEARGK